MILLSVNCVSKQVRAYICTNRQRTKCKDVKFDRVLEADEVEAMRRNPEKFISDLMNEAPDTTPSETEPSVA